MRTTLLIAAAAAALAAAAAPPAIAQTAPAAAPTQGLQVETRAFTLSNGLRVVLSRDATVPTATVAVYYGIGFRIEPRNRTGFAHLFEHLMFMGSENVPRGAFDRNLYNAGGVNNGSTRFDFTNYFEVAPSNALDLILWMEADRMARPVIDQAVLTSQQGVVANEVRVNVLNQPYGGWPWIDLPMLANENWHNSHNFYGELSDLEAATVADARDFFDNFYRPNNAVLVVAGDIDYDATRAMIERYFGPIPRGEPVVLPDISEPRQTREKFRVRRDPLAPRPAYSIAYHVPPRGSPEWYAMGLIDQMLVQGQDSRLHRRLVQETGITGEVDGGINIGLGNMFNYRGPMLWTVAFVHDPGRTREEIETAMGAEIESLRTRPVTAGELERARTKMRSFLYGQVDSGTRFGLVDLLASYALFDDDPAAVNRIEAGFAAVTPELIQRTAQEYLRPTNRSVLLVEPAPAQPGTTTGGQP
ncbi:M16 family metallopeptidase [Sphingosinicella terrae]|uniref:M16 family metallopeptidase n=1 Tax=Sphingosinicella terrae TaxID=2172047 RepID=UPI000E0CFEC5|nr:pitrilysin family protein [Sphingosinicella terrae]